jgi:hypothetical protein
VVLCRDLEKVLGILQDLASNKKCAFMRLRRDSGKILECKKILERALQVFQVRH